MVTPYRDPSVPRPLKCPRCKKHELPPLDVARCPKSCGTWVSAFAASEVLTPTDRRHDPVKRWWRVREPCPDCAEQMLLHGEDPGLLQGCELHGFFIDADTIEHTGLARGVDEAAIERKRNDPDLVAAERERVFKLEQDRAVRDAALEKQRSALAARVEASTAEHDRRQRVDRVHAMLFYRESMDLARYIVALEDRLAALEARLP
jgi:hypothetical protein